MKPALPPLGFNPDLFTPIPGWVMRARAETLEDAAFLSGAALSHLHSVLGSQVLPHALVRERLALKAAEAALGFTGRPERAEDLRDAVYLLRPGDAPGPAGEVLQCWRRAAQHPVSVKALARALSGFAPETVARWLNAGQGAPLERAAGVLGTVLDEAPREEAVALILADATLAAALGWEYLVPLLALGLKRADLRKSGDELRLACHRAAIAAAVEAVALAADLARRAARLSATRPKLRAKGADGAVALFLSRDALAPSALTSLGSDRAARRFCDRLVELGVAREITGRDTFRLYGV